MDVEFVEVGDDEVFAEGAGDEVRGRRGVEGGEGGVVRFADCGGTMLGGVGVGWGGRGWLQARMALSGPPWKVRSCSSPGMPRGPMYTGPGGRGDLSMPERTEGMPGRGAILPERISRRVSEVTGAVRSISSGAAAMVGGLWSGGGEG